MTPKQESAMRQGLAALERVDKISGYPNNKKTITTLREALEHIGDTTEMVEHIDPQARESIPLSAIRAIAVEAIRSITGCPDIKGNGRYLVDEIEDVAKAAIRRAIVRAAAAIGEMK